MVTGVTTNESMSKHNTLLTEAVEEQLEHNATVRAQQEARILLAVTGLVDQGAVFSDAQVGAAYNVWCSSRLVKTTGTMMGGYEPSRGNVSEST